MKYLTAILLIFTGFATTAQMSNRQMRSFEMQEVPQSDTPPKKGDFKFIVTVADRLTGDPIEGANVKLYQSETTGTTLSSKKNGTCTFNLNSGTYGLMISVDDYQFYMDTITVGNDNLDKEFIYLYPKKGVQLVPVEGSKL